MKTLPPTGAIQATLAPGDDVHTWVSVAGDLAWFYDVDVLRLWSLADPELTSRDIELPFQAR